MYDEVSGARSVLSSQSSLRHGHGQLGNLSKRAEGVGCSTRLVCAIWNVRYDMDTERVGLELERLGGRRDSAEDDSPWHRLPSSVDELGNAILEFSDECDAMDVWGTLYSLALWIVGISKCFLASTYSLPERL